MPIYHFIICLTSLQPGTIADWAIVVITSITSLFLLFTLISQKKVQKAQLKVTQIEVQRFIRDQKLQFDINFTKKEIHKVGSELIMAIFDLEIQLQNSACLMTEILIESKNTKLTLPRQEKLKYDNLIEGTILELHLRSEILENQYKDEGGNIAITINFKDYIGNEYIQAAEIRFKEGSGGLTIMPKPKLVSSE